nr:GTP-binding protein [Desulfobulbaceae bacterium]
MSEIHALRNVGIFGHGKCGKTSLAEALLFTAGKTTRLGKVDDGSSCMDFEPEEIQRNLSISSSFNNLSWNKKEVFLTDTPGDDNFLNDSIFATQVVDSAIFTIGAVLGVKHQTERIADFLVESGLPTLIFINKMDRERANFDRTIKAINDILPLKAAVIHLPIGSESNFKGVIDLVNQDAYMFDGSTGKVRKALVPKEMADEVVMYRESLMELVAETDDDLIEKFLEEGELSDEDLKAGLVNAIKSAKLSPILAGAATANLGTELLLNAITDLLPSPAEHAPFVGTSPKGEIEERASSPDAPFSALVFKTMADPYSGKLTLFRVMSGTLTGDTFLNSTKDTPERFGQLLTIEGKESKPVSTAIPGMIVAVAKLKATTTGDTLCDAAKPIIYQAKAAIKPT